MALMLGPPSIITGIICLLSKRRLPLAELIIPSMLAGVICTIVLIHGFQITGATTARLRTYAMYIWFLNVWVFAVFVKSTWLWGFLVRFLTFIPVTTVFVFIKDGKGDDVSVSQAITTVLVIGLLIEISVYNNAKQTALLFARLKVTEKQQKQMADLLDSMPDSVFICTKGSDDKQTCPIYANLQTNVFFGRNILLPAKTLRSRRRRKTTTDSGDSNQEDSNDTS